MLILCSLLLPKSQILILLYLERLENDSVRLVRRLDLEQLVHDLKRNTLRFRDQEESTKSVLCCRPVRKHGDLHVWNREEHEAGEEHVYAVTHFEEHLRRESRDEEIPKPVTCGRERLAWKDTLAIPLDAIQDVGNLPSDRVCCEYISELMTHGVPFQDGV